MGFVYPQFLWALVALVIPLLIHLFNLRHSVRVYFSDNRFLKRIKKQTGHKQKLKKRLLLLTRLLFLFFLILAFAQPFVGAKEPASSNKHVVCYLDNSLSMSLRKNDVRALDTGLEFIRKLIEAFPKDTHYKLVTNEFDTYSTTFKSAEATRDRLAQIQLSPTFRTAEEIEKRLEKDTTEASVFWISDFQRSVFSVGTPQKANTGNQWHPVPIPLTRHANIYIDSVYLKNPFLGEGNPNSLTVKLVGTVPEKTERVRLKLLINDIQSGIASADITPNTPTEITFDLANHLSGLNKARIHIDDPYADFDNDFYFTLNLTNAIRVIDISDGLANNYIKEVFGNSKIFSYTPFRADNIAYHEVTKADLIVLNGLNRLDDALLSALTAVSPQKTTILLVPGTEPNLLTYKKLLPWPALKVDPNSGMMTLEAPPVQHPFFANVFESQDVPPIMPTARKWLDWGKDRSAILRFNDQTPFLSQKNNFFVLACPIQKKYTDFYNHALFVPIAYKIAMATARQKEALYYVPTQKVVVLEMGNALKNIPLRMVGTQQEIIPTQYQTGSSTRLEIPHTALSPGIYAVQQHRDTVTLLAINPDKRESDLQGYPLDKIPLPHTSYNLQEALFQWADPTIFANDIKERYLGTSLWQGALLIALSFLLLETLLIRYLK